MVSLRNYWSALRFKLSLHRHLSKYRGSKYFNPKGINQFSFSQYSQDLVLLPIVALLLKKLTAIQILDIGANHPIHFSNSCLIEYLFDTIEVIAVDPLLSMEEQWHLWRPSAQFINCAVSDREGVAYMRIPTGKSNMFSTLVQEKESFSSDNFVFQDVPVLSLSSIVDKYITKHYILLIDVENHEECIIQQIPACHDQPIIVVAENNGNGLLGCDRLRSTMIAFDYHYLGRLGPNDDIFIHNSYLHLLNLNNHI